MTAASRPRRLDDLPDEIIQKVIHHLNARPDLVTLCLVSRRISSIASPLLYRSIAFTTPKHHVTFSTSLKRGRPRRGSLIQDVRLEYPSSELEDVMSHLELREDVVGRIDHFSYAVSTMSNLETLVISVPESLCQGIGTLFNSPFDLACLKTCSLFYQTPNNTYWDLQTNIHIFAHPTLESLTIRRARLDKRGFDSLEQPNLTPLTTLSFIDCDINDDGLSDLLAIPESLSSFSISQKQFPNPPLKESPDDVDEYFIALRSAEHSLESVRIDFPGLSAEHPLKLRRFEKVTKLDIRDYQLFGQTDGPRLHTVGLPPFLEELRFLNPLEDEDIAELVVYTLENRFTLGFARKLKRIVVAREDHTDFVPSPVWERASSPVWGRSPFSFEEPVKEAGWIPTLRKACVEAEVELVVE